MKKNFFEPEVEVIEFEVSELKGIATSETVVDPDEDKENPVEGEDWW